jgi:iron complex transport system substrate-binding protein
MDTTEPKADLSAREFWKRWPSVPAVRDGRVHVFDASAALRPGPRVADAVEMLADLLHPPKTR